MCLPLSYNVIWLKARALFISSRRVSSFIFSPEYTTDFHNRVSSCFWTSPWMFPKMLKIMMSNIKFIYLISEVLSLHCFSYCHLLSDFPGWEPKIQPSPHPLCRPITSVTKLCLFISLPFPFFYLSLPSKDLINSLK